MDSVTQATLGAAIGEAMFGEKIGRKGALIGAIIATVPDLDVLIIPFYSPLAKISIHRGFSHSILFTIVAAILIAIVLKRRKEFGVVSYHKLLLFAWLALFTHILLDTFTAYGTQLFLPFSDVRFGFDSINIIDPVYTVPLIIGLVLSLWWYKDRKKRSIYTKYALVLSTFYLCITLVIKNYVNQRFELVFASEGVEYQKMMTQPVGWGSLHWYGVGKTGKGLYIGQYNFRKQEMIDLNFYPTNDSLLEDLDSVLVNRMKWFSKDFYVVAGSKKQTRFYNMQCDMQGLRFYKGKKMPTAFYFEITPQKDSGYYLTTGMHPREAKTE